MAIKNYTNTTPFKLRSQSSSNEDKKVALVGKGESKDYSYLLGNNLPNVTGGNPVKDDENIGNYLTDNPGMETGAGGGKIIASDYATNIQTATKTTADKQWLIDNPGGGNVSAADIRRRKKAIKAQARANKKLEAKGLQTIDMIPPPSK